MDVGVGEVVGPDRGPLGPGLEVDRHADLARLEVDRRGVGVRGGLLADPDAVDRDVEVGGVEGRVRGADGGEHAAPVGVVAEHRGLEEVAAGDAARDLDGLVLGGGVEGGDGDLVVGALGVTLGAFGAHALPGRLGKLGYAEPDFGRRIEIFETAVRYQMYHALALGLVALVIDRSPKRIWQMAGWVFLFGIYIFCGLLYVLTFVADDYRWLGAIVPIGGLSLITGWVMLAVGALRE